MKKIIFFLTVFFMITTAAKAQEEAWEFTGWYGGGAFPAVVADPNVASRAYLLSDVSGVWRSEDRGDRWIPKNSGLNTLKAVTLAVSRSARGTAYLGTQNGIWRSDDSGGSWRYLPATKDILTFRRPANYRSIVTHPTDPLTIYAGNQEGQVYATADGGETWGQLPGEACPLGSKTPVSAILLTADGRHLFAGSEKGLAFYSVSDKKWSAMDTFGAALDIASTIDENGETIYVTRGKKITWSTDLGRTWSSSGDLPIGGGHVNRLAIHDGKKGRTLLGAWRDGWNGGLYISEDAGQTWTDAERALSHDVIGNPTREWMTGWGWPLSVSFDPFLSATIYFTDFWGVWRSDDAGKTWKERVQGAPNTVGSDILVAADGRILAATMDNGLLESRDGGLTYKALCPVSSRENDLKGHIWRVLTPGFGQTVVATSSSWNGSLNEILLSDNGGSSWKRVKKGLPSAYPRVNTVWEKGYARALAADPSDPRRLYLGIDGDDGGGFFYSEDAGESWTRPASQPDSLRIYNALAVDPSATNRIYWGSAGTAESGGVFLSEDRGQTWSRIFSESGWVFDLAVSREGVVYAAVDASGPALYTSADGGKTWNLLKKFEDGNSACEAITIDPTDSARVAVSTVRWDGAAGGKIYLTRDGGQTWNDLTGGLPNGAGAAAMAFGPGGSHLYVSRYAGSIYRARLDTKTNTEGV